MSPAVEYRRNLYGLVALLAAVVVAGLAISSAYAKTMIIFSMIHAISAIGLCLLFGYGGQISLGQSGFVGLGAYVTAYLVQKAGVHPLVATIAAVCLPGALAWVIARPLLRLASHYLAMATLAFGVIMFIFFSELRFITGGVDPGIIGMPPFRLFGTPLSGTDAMFWVCSGALVITMACAINIAHSRVGRALRALREAEVPAAGLGIDTVRYKTAIFVVSAGMSGLGGALYAFYTRSFNASSFDVWFAIDLLVMVVVGSVTSPWGALVGACVITVLPSFLESYELYKPLLYGLLMAAIMVFMPRGLTQAAFDAAAVLRRRAA